MRAIRPLRSMPARGALPLLAGVALAWGANWPVMKIGLRMVPPLWFATERFALGGLCLALVAASLGKLRPPPRSDWPLVLGIGLLQMALFTALVAAALRAVPAGRAALLAYTTPVWVLPLAAALLGERPGTKGMTAVVLCLGGVAALVLPGLGVGPLWPASLLVAAAAAWALTIVQTRAHRPTASPLALAPWQALVALLALAPAAWAVEGAPPRFGLSLVLVLLYVGPVATAFPFWALLSAGPRVSAGTMSVAMLASPCIGLALSVALLGEAVTWGLAAGVGLIATGVILSLIPSHPTGSLT